MKKITFLCLLAYQGAFAQPVPGSIPAPAAGPALAVAPKPVAAQSAPIEARFEQPAYLIDPAATTEDLWIDVKNTSHEPVSVTHVSPSALMLTRLPAPVVLGPGETARFGLLLYTQAVPSRQIHFQAAVGYDDQGHTQVIRTSASAMLRGIPQFSAQQLVWQIGDPLVEKSTKVTLPGGEKLKDLQVMGPPGNFSFRVDAAAGMVYVTPLATSKATGNRFELITEPPLNPRIHQPFMAVIENPRPNIGPQVRASDPAPQQVPVPSAPVPPHP